MDNRLCVGVIIGAHGVKGVVRIKSFTEDPAAVATLGVLEDEAGERRFRLKNAREAKGVVTAKLDGVDTRDQAEMLKGVKLTVPRSALPEPEDEDDFYVLDLIGLTAETLSGAALGKVKGVVNYGAGDILEIAAETGVILTPFTRKTAPVVDIGNGRIVVDPPDWTETGEEEREEE